MFKYLILVFVSIFALSCGSNILKVDPYEKNIQKKDCKDDCKGLKGKQRADCNKRCN